MSEPQGPLDSIPRINYPPLLTLANYLSTTQMIGQVLSEDQEYVSWKIKNMRTGGTMNDYLQPFLVRQEKTKEHGRFAVDEYYGTERPSGLAEQTTKGDNNLKLINEVPPNLKFPREIYEENLTMIPRPRELDQDEQFKLLVTNLDEDQTNRFEVFHRTSLNKTQVKKLAGMVINQSVTENMRVFLQAAGKIYAGDIIELALRVREKWLVARSSIQFSRRKIVGKRLIKYLKKLTLLVDNNHDKEEYNDDVDETASDSYYDDEEEEMKDVEEGNKLIKSEANTQEIRLALITHYNRLVREFNSIDVSVEKYANSPILPEHIREAWRLHQLQTDGLPSTLWRTQGEGNGWMFR
ncbi:related to Transcription initiation factor TFIID subunit 11 [Zygosaccharomyces bailii]|nr:related to Transcription initiation factor TFIID subunit 11 [Zygosaccharomyces bailii]